MASATTSVRAAGLPRTATLVALGAGSLVSSATIVVLVGWALDITVLTGVLPTWPQMAPGTAVGLLLIGSALVLAGVATDVRRSPWFRRVSQGCVLLALLVGLLRLSMYAFGWELGIDAAFLPSARMRPARMSPATAHSLVLLAAALLVAARPRAIVAFNVLTFTAALIAWLGISRYVFGGEPLVPYAQMALHTACCFLVLSAGVLCLRREDGLVGLLAANSAGGATARRLLPPALFVPIVLAWIRLFGQRAGWYGTEAGLSLYAISNVAVFGALVWANATRLHRSDRERGTAERKVAAQLQRLSLLQQITRAIAERQDLHSIFQVVIRSLEDSLPVDFVCVCLYDPSSQSMTVTRVGLRSAALASELALPEQARFAIDENGLARCVRGQLVYEEDLVAVPMPFPRRLARGGLRSLVIAPLASEDRVFGVLVAARREPRAFSSGECEFLRQLSEHVGLASHQTQLYVSLQQSYDELRRTQQAVTQQERLHAVGQMASGLAHDINNALSPVALYTESLLEREEGLSPAGRTKLETIGRAIDDVAATVARMREFYRGREAASTMAPVDLNRLVEQVVTLTSARWKTMPQEHGKVVHASFGLTPDLPAAVGNETEIREALVNLVFNAVDAMPNGGTLTLRTGAPSPGEMAAGERRLIVEVADTGVGMDDETRRRCLEPFFTTKGERGTGLGLAMVYGIAQRHGADIEIESELGAGTTVRLVFPIADAVRDPAPVASAVVTAPLRILVVDDDPLVLKSLRETLEADGHRVVAADGGQAGIAMFCDASQPFDIVMTDLGMPYVDGRQVAAAVKDASSATPVILLTGWGQRLAAEGDAPPAHVDSLLTKPPKLDELRRALARLTTRGPGET